MRFLLAFLLAMMGYAAHAQLSGGGGGAPESAEALQQKCSAGNAVACANLGFRHLRGDGLPKDAKQALTLFMRACDGGDAIGCTSAGDIHFSGEAVTRNLPKAAALYQRGCDGGDGEGCVALALSHGKGEGVAKDDARTALYADRACKLNNQLGCALLGLAFAEGVEGYARDSRRADDLLSTACFKGARFSERPDAASHVACPGLAKLRGEPSCMTEVIVSSAESRRHCYDDKAGWVTTVTPRATAPSSGAVAPAQPGGTASAFAVNAANLAGIKAYDARDYGTALMRYAEACDQGVATACGSLGAMYFKGTGVSRNGARAAPPLATACDAGLTYACAYLAVLYDNGDGVTVNKAMAFTLFNGACSNSDIESCFHLGRLYQSGQGTTVNLVQAALLYQKACNAGVADGCSSIGTMHANGVHFPRSEAQAESFYNLACRKGGKKGCELSASLVADRERRKANALAEAQERKRALAQSNQSFTVGKPQRAVDCIKSTIAPLPKRGTYSECRFGECKEYYQGEVGQSMDDALFRMFNPPRLKNICDRPVDVHVKYSSSELPHEKFTMLANESNKATTYVNPIVVDANWAKK